MDVKIVRFPETRVAAIEHFGSPALEHDTVGKLVAWKIQNRLLDPLRYRHYGVHYTDPHKTVPSQHHVDFCLSFDEKIGQNPYGITNKLIPSGRCALVRDVGFRSNNKAAVYICETWLPQSGESLGDFPIFFHYVNVGPHVREEDTITDVYLRLK